MMDTRRSQTCGRSRVRSGVIQCLALREPPVLQCTEERRALGQYAFRSKPSLSIEPKRSARLGNEHGRATQRAFSRAVKQHGIAIGKTCRKPPQNGGRKAK